MSKFYLQQNLQPINKNGKKLIEIKKFKLWHMYVEKVLDTT